MPGFPLAHVEILLRSDVLFVTSPASLSLELMHSAGCCTNLNIVEMQPRLDVDLRAVFAVLLCIVMTNPLEVRPVSNPLEVVVGILSNLSHAFYTSKYQAYK